MPSHCTRSRANPDKSKSTNDFIPQEAKVWNDGRLQGAKYHRYTIDVYVKQKMNRDTSFRINQFSFYLRGAGVEAVLWQAVCLCTQHCNTKSAWLPSTPRVMQNHQSPSCLVLTSFIWVDLPYISQVSHHLSSASSPQRSQTNTWSEN